MDNILTNKDLKKAEDQLLKIEIIKKDIKKRLYILYESYLRNIRSKIGNSIKRAIVSLVELSILNLEIKNKEIVSFINDDIDLLINRCLPFLTIEQLNILATNEIRNPLQIENLFSKFNFIDDKQGLSKNLENIEYSNIYISNYGYYQRINDNDLINSIDLDNNSNLIQNDHLLFDEGLNIPLSSVLDHNTNSKLSEKNYNYNQEKNISNPKVILDIYDLIDSLDYSLNYQLKTLSIDINKLLIKNNIIKINLNDDFLNYIIEDDFLVSNPLPYINLVDLSSQQLMNAEKYSDLTNNKIYLFNINSIEIEFNEITLNIIRNKLLNFRSKLNSLSKKQKYWEGKKFISKNNRDCNTAI